MILENYVMKNYIDKFLITDGENKSIKEESLAQLDLSANELMFIKKF